MIFWFPKCVCLILKWHFWFKKHGDSLIPEWHPILGGQRRPNILLSERNNMTPWDREDVPWEVVSLASYETIWCLSEVHIDSREKGTWHWPTARICFPLASVAGSLNGRDFVTRLAAKQATFTEARRRCWERFVHKQPATRGILLREFNYYSLLPCTTVKLLMDYNLAYA